MKDNDIVNEFCIVVIFVFKNKGLFFMDNIQKSEFRPLDTKVEKDNNFIFIPNMKGKIQSTMGSMSDFYSCDRYSEQNCFICGVKK